MMDPEVSNYQIRIDPLEETPFLTFEVFTIVGHFTLFMQPEDMRNIAVMMMAKAELKLNPVPGDFPEEWADEMLPRIQLTPDTCGKPVGKPHKAHRWETEDGCYKCPGNWGL